MRVLHVVFIIGVGVLYACVLRPYPPMDAGILMLTLLVVCLGAGSVLFGVGRDQHVRGKSILAAVTPFLLAGLLIANGVLDRSEEALHRTVVVQTTYGRAWIILDVQSWRPGRKTESLYLKTGFPWSRNPGFFLEGRPVTVGVMPGALGIQWISSITRD